MVHACLPRISKQGDQGPPDDLDSIKGTGPSKVGQAFPESLGNETLLRSILEGVALGSITFQTRNPRKVLPVDTEWHQRAPLDIRGISDATLLAPAGTLCPTTMLPLQDEGCLRLKIRIR
ncbi:MAG: hypothetical protein RL333_1113 [Pseudomonadota bacterium]